MKKEVSYSKSKDGVSTLYKVTFKPEGKMIATLIVSHGIGEHIGRYEELAMELTKKGIAVIGLDDIGHGHSISNKKAPMYFGKEGSWQYLVDDLKNLIELMRNRYNVPTFVMGFSMGSFVVRTLMAQEKLNADGVILAGTGKISEFVANMVKKLISSEVRKCGSDDKVSTKVNELAFGNYNRFFKPCKTEFDWLCENEEGIKGYIEDSLSQKFITPGMFRELIGAIAYTSKKTSIEKVNPNMPILFLSGEDDPVGDFKKGVKKIEKIFRKYNKNTEMIFYPDSRHDIFHDNSQQKVQNDIATWILAHEKTTK